MAESIGKVLRGRVSTHQEERGHQPSEGLGGNRRFSMPYSRRP